MVDNNHALAREFKEFVSAREFPCVGAKAALSRQQMDFIIGGNMASAWDDLRILPGLVDVVRRYRRDKTLFRSFIVVFSDETPRTETDFEHLLWERVQSLVDKDDWLGYKPDPSVDESPESPYFGVSFGGEAFFVVGLHPNASRPARRFAHPALVFNLHDQFVALREQGKYEKMRETIIERDIALAGKPNPMLARHGEVSEARQYSGRAVSSDWKCPYQSRAA